MNQTLIKQTSTFKSLSYYGRRRLLRDGVIPVTHNPRLPLARRAFEAVLEGEDYWANPESKNYSIWTLPEEIGASGAESVTRQNGMVMIHYNFQTRVSVPTEEKKQ